MRHAKRVAKTVLLCILPALLGMTMLMAPGAGAAWLIELTTDEEVIVEDHGSHGILLVPSKGLEVLCTSVSSLSLVLQVSPLTGILGRVDFNECVTRISGTESPNCQPKEPITMIGKGGVISHNGKEYVLLEGDEKASEVFRFGRVDYPALCALPDTNLNGELTLECLNASLESDSCSASASSHLLREVTLGLKGGLLYGVNPATLDGVVAAKLASGQSWSGHV